MANYEQGIATRIHYLRLSVEDTEKVRLEAATLGIPMAELFRRMLDLYFEVKASVPASASPTLTPHQAESFLASTSDGGTGKKDIEDKFNFIGEKE